MKKLIWLLLILLPILGFSQNHVPEEWYGEYVGRLNIYNAAGLSMQLNMELLVTPTDSAHRANWTISYLPDDTTGALKNDRREYELIGQSDYPAHYVIDEKNSILLDCYLMDNVMISRFRVNKALLIINYTLLGDSVRVEIFSGPYDAVRDTGEEVEEVDNIQAFGINGYHRAILYRRK